MKVKIKAGSMNYYYWILLCDLSEDKKPKREPIMIINPKTNIPSFI